MPESPEVQALAEFLDERLTGHVIEEIELDEFRALKTRARPLGELVGGRVTGLRRFGKHVAVDLDVEGVAVSLVISFGRAGWARWNGDAAPDAAPVIGRLVLDVTGGGLLELTDAGEWLSLGLSVVDDPGDVPAIAKLGPDPADPSFTREQFDAVIVGRRKQLKALLQEQESLAGIGNAYSDEILHVARLSPVVHAASLDPGERDRLFAGTTGVLQDAIAARRGVPLHELKAAKVAAMRVHGRGGETCPVCGTTIAEHASGSAAAQYCPGCQTGGAIL